MRTVAIILARGGSKGIPGKNIVDFCGKPLLAWTIEQCRGAKGIDSIWVSSDSDEILSIGLSYGAKSLHRPPDLSGDLATSESGWLHALEIIENETGPLDAVLAPQVTSPLRESSDIERGLAIFDTREYDSIFSCSLAEDLYFWQKTSKGVLESINYDSRNRKRRQDHQPQYIENGSFYIFTPDVLRRFNNRFGKCIGMVEMEFWKTFEVDSPETLRLCKALMREFLLRQENDQV